MMARSRSPEPNFRAEGREGRYDFEEAPHRADEIIGMRWSYRTRGQAEMRTALMGGPKIAELPGSEPSPHVFGVALESEVASQYQTVER